MHFSGKSSGMHAFSQTISLNFESFFLPVRSGTVHLREGSPFAVRFRAADWSAAEMGPPSNEPGIDGVHNFLRTGKSQKQSAHQRLGHQKMGEGRRFLSSWSLVEANCGGGFLCKEHVYNDFGPTLWKNADRSGMLETGGRYPPAAEDPSERTSAGTGQDLVDVLYVTPFLLFYPYFTFLYTLGL